MRSLISLALISSAVLAALAGSARADEPAAGTLTVERGRGSFVLEVRGSVLGRLTNGSITVTDRSPNDPYVATITGRKVQVQRRLGPAKLFIRGQGLRFRMLGGSYRIVIRGSGVALSAVGRGVVSLDGEPRFPGDDMGVYSTLEGVDCSVDPASCIVVPDEPVRLKLEPPPTEDSGKTSLSR